jgi:replication factor C subunit 1
MSHSAQDSEKHTLMTPFTLIEKLFSPYAFSATSKQTLTDKLDYYFHDFSSMPLFTHENYLKFNFSRSSGLFGRERDMKRLELVEKASASISDGDILDSVIHGSEQHWSLLPAHGVASTVRPAYFCYGMGAYGTGAGGFTSASSSRAFPAWFGKNSSGNRLKTALGNVQIHMRLAVSGDRREIRQSYLPLLAQKLAQPLAEKGNDGVEETIALMDDYYLTKDEYDTIMELGLEDYNGEVLLKGVDTKVKAALTKKCVSRSL